jgi:DNA-binding GntR family transcriptional regulator
MIYIKSNIRKEQVLKIIKDHSTEEMGCRLKTTEIAKQLGVSTTIIFRVLVELENKKIISRDRFFVDGVQVRELKIIK